MPRENEVASVAGIECCCLGLKRSDSKMNAEPELGYQK